jgi:general secretion pathway protein D
LGNLFRYDLDIEKRTELLIILTPHVIQNEEQMEQMKQLESSRIHWCLADVTEMFGDTGLYDIADDSINDGAATVIYPDDDPIGTSPEGYELLNPPVNEGAWPPSSNDVPSEPTPAEAPSLSEVSTSRPRLRDRFFARQRDNRPADEQVAPMQSRQVAPMPNSYQESSPTYAAQPPSPAPQGYAPQFDPENPLRPPDYQSPVPTAEYNTPFPDPNAPSQVKQTNYVGPRQSGTQFPRMEPYPQRTQEPTYYQSDAGWKQWDNTVYR